MCSCDSMAYTNTNNVSPSGNPVTGAGSYGSDASISSSGARLSNYFSTLTARICPKCSAFWIILALIALYIYLRKR